MRCRFLFPRFGRRRLRKYPCHHGDNKGDEQNGNAYANSVVAHRRPPILSVSCARKAGREEGILAATVSAPALTRLALNAGFRGSFNGLAEIALGSGRCLISRPGTARMKRAG